MVFLLFVGLKDQGQVYLLDHVMRLDAVLIRGMKCVVLSTFRESLIVLMMN